ncbi:MAG: hypothetical protein ACP5N3_04160 [Candidatus Nanoarchaeia archaeon]
MNQDEIFMFLCMQRLTGNHQYWRKIEIFNELKKKGFKSGLSGKGLVGAKVNQLMAFGFLEMIQDDECVFPIQRFRVKEKYLNVVVPEVTIFWEGKTCVEEKKEC